MILTVWMNRFFRTYVEKTDPVGARDWNRTSTPVRALPPQDSASTYSATRADGDPARARTWDPLINLPHRLSPAINMYVVVWTISSPFHVGVGWAAYGL